MLFFVFILYRCLFQYVKSLNKTKNLNKSQLLGDLNISLKRHFEKYPQGFRFYKAAEDTVAL